MTACEALTTRGPCRNPHATLVEFSRPFHPSEPRSEGAVAFVLDPVICASHQRMLKRAAEQGWGVTLVTEVWGIER